MLWTSYLMVTFSTRGNARLGQKMQVNSLCTISPVENSDPEKSHTHTDRYLFGHPSHRVFESPNRFYPHFRYLMRRDNYHEVCSCHLCQKTKKAQTRQSSVKKAGGIRARPPLAARPTDDEGLPLSLSILFDLLQKENRLERLIQENQSMVSLST